MQIFDRNYMPFPLYSLSVSSSIENKQSAVICEVCYFYVSPFFLASYVFAVEVSNIQQIVWSTVH